MCLISARTISEDWSSSGDSKNEEEEKERRSPRDKESKDKDKDTECKFFLRVYIVMGQAPMKYWLKQWQWFESQPGYMRKPCSANRWSCFFQLWQFLPIEPERAIQFIAKKEDSVMGFCPYHC